MNILDAWETTEVVSYVLRKLGIRADLLGYDYLCSAIELSIADVSYLHNITKALYPEVAKIHNTTPTRVERAIRHSIEALLNSGRAAFTAYEMIDMPADKVTNSQFIGTLVRLITREPHHPIFNVRDCV